MLQTGKQIQFDFHDQSKLIVYVSVLDYERLDVTNKITCLATSEKVLATDVPLRVDATTENIKRVFDGECIVIVRKEDASFEELTLPDESWFSGVVCEARNKWQEEIGSKHDMEFDFNPGEHPDDWTGKYIRDQLIEFMKSKNKAKPS